MLEEDQLLEITDDGALKSMFETTSNFHMFWVKVKVEYPEIAANAPRKVCFHFQHPIFGKQSFQQ